MQGVSNPVIKGLLDDLYTLEVVSTEEKEFVMENQKIKTDMADSMKFRDKHLCSDLGLISSSAAVAEM